MVKFALSTTEATARVIEQANKQYTCSIVFWLMRSLLLHAYSAADRVVTTDAQKKPISMQGAVIDDHTRAMADNNVSMIIEMDGGLGAAIYQQSPVQVLRHSLQKQSVMLCR